MNKFIPRTLVAAALVMPALAYSQAVPVQFDPDGAGAATARSIDLLDWAPGSALSVNGNPSGGVTELGTPTQLLYQANLSVATQTGAVFNTVTNCITGQCFTAVAGFEETAFLSGSTINFALTSAPARSATNFFYIYASNLVGGVPKGDNLAGTGFAGGTLVLSGYITQLVSGNYTQSGTNIDPVTGLPNRLDNFGNDDWSGVSTIVGSGATDINVALDFINAAYFPGLSAASMVFSFFNSSVVTPFDTVDPSRLFSSNGILDGDTAANVGDINGGFQSQDRNFILLADANQSFQVARVPEPESLALVGLALGALGFASRRRNTKNV